MFIKTQKACKELGIHPNTLRRWAKLGKIQFIRSGQGHRLYNIEDFIEKNNMQGKVINEIMNKKNKTSE
jgi:excisionase family DNA binding protein